MGDVQAMVIRAFSALCIMFIAFYAGRFIEDSDSSIIMRDDQAEVATELDDRKKWMRETHDIVKANAILIGKNAETIDKNIGVIEELRTQLLKLTVTVARIEERERLRK